MKYYQTPQFKKLQQEWYNKLKEQSFKDIETNENLNLDLGKYRYYHSADSALAKEEYFSALQEALSQYECDTPIHSTIMILKASGRLIQEIVRVLNAAGTPVHRKTIRYIIRNYENRWGIRIYDKRKLDPNWKRQLQNS